MKQTITILALILLSSCSKTWNCTTTVTTQSEFYDNVSSTDVEIEGSKEDAEAYEVANSRTIDLMDGGTITQTTECK